MSINLASRLSAITTDFTGVNHIVWVEGNAIWHAQFDAIAGRWVNAQAVVTNITENVTSLNLIANEKLIGGKTPGLAVIWQQGDEQKNSSNFQYSAAQYDSNGQLQWDATPTQFTVNETTDGQPFTNLAPRAIADNKGTITVVGQQVNITNANDQSLREDVDLYSTVLNINTVTPGTPSTPNAFYEPSVIVDGVNPVPTVTVNPVPATQNTDLAVATAQSFSTPIAVTTQSFSTLATAASPASTSAYQGSGFSFGPSLSFTVGVLQGLGLNKYLEGIPRSTVSTFVKDYQIVGTLSGTIPVGNSPTVQLSSSGSIVPLQEENEKTKKDQLRRIVRDVKGDGELHGVFQKTTVTNTKNLTFSFSSSQTFNGTSPYNLKNISNSFTFSGSDSVKIERNDILELFTASLTFTGSLGLVANLTLEPKSPNSESDNNTLFQLLLETLGTDIGVSFATLLVNWAATGSGKEALAATYLADAVFLPILNLLLGDLKDVDNLEVTNVQIGPTLGFTLNGQIAPDHIPALNLQASGGVTLNFLFNSGGTNNQGNEGEETTQLVIPLSASANIGPLGFSISINPSWQWPSNPSVPSSGTSTASAALMSNAVATNTFESLALATTATTATMPMATVMGSLLTLNFDAPLDTSSIPDPSDFSLQTTTLGPVDPNTAYKGSVSGVTVSNDPTTGNGVVVLQLTEPLAYSPQFSGTDPQPAGQMAISLTYSGTGLQFSDDTAVSDFSNLSVTNNSPQSLAIIFNPTKGTGNDYSTTNQTAFLSNLEADYAQDSPPALTLLSSTTNAEGQVLGVWSREVQPLTPIAGFVNGDTIYLNFVQNLNTFSVSPDSSQFTVTTSGDASSPTVTKVLITNGAVQLTLSDAVAEGDTVTVTYQPSTRPMSSLPTNQSADMGPAIIGSNGTLYMAYKGNDDTYIYFTTSTNDGLTWESATQLSSDFNTNSSPALAFYNDTLYLAYLGEGNNELNFVYSSDEGQTWSSQVTLSSQTSGAGISLVEYQGYLMAFYVDADSSDIRYVYSNNPSSSSSWSTEQTVTNPGGGSSYPNQTTSDTVSATVLNDTLYLAYRGGTVGNGTNYYVTATTGTTLSSLSWSVTEVSNATNPNTAPSLTNDGKLIYLSYGASSDDNNTIYYLTSNNGTEWSSLEAVTNQATNSYMPMATILDGVLYIGYTQSNEIYVSVPTTNLNLTSAVESQLWIPTFSESPTNTTGQDPKAAPQLLGGSVIVESGANNLITLIFNAPLDASNTPDSSAFTVINNGQTYSGDISNVTVSNNIVTFQLAASDSNPIISPGDMATVTYTYTPGSTADQNLTGANGVAIGTVSTQLTTLPETPTTALMAGLYTPGSTSGVISLQSIPGTDGFNLDPAVASDTNGNALAVWVYADTSDIDNLSTPGEFYTDDDTQAILDNLNQSDIYFSYWNGGQWSLAAPLATNQPGTDNNVTLTYDTTNNQYIAAWLNTQENTTTGDDDVTIYWASYDPSSSTWSSINQVLSEATPDPLTDLVISSVNGQPALFWTETQAIAYAQLTEDNNPFLYWRLGELSGTTANNSGIWGAGAQGTYNGTYTLNKTGALFNSATSEGDLNPAALFSNGGSVTLGSALNVGGSAFSIEFWFKTPSVPSSSTNLVSLDGVFSTALGQDSNGDTILTFDLANSTSATISTSASSNPIATDTWYYVVGTYSDQTQELSLYLNGQPVQTLDSVSATFPTSATFTIAGGTDAVYLDEVALYGTALSYSDTPTSVEDMTGLDLIESLMGTNVIGEKYAAQYAEPLSPGPQLQFSLLSSDNTWSSQSQINPLSLLEPTALNDAKAPVWDVVSATTPNSTGNINPNGQQDSIFKTTLNGYQGKTIDSMTLTLSNGITYSVGGSNNDHQLGVVIGNNLINNSAPNASFSYTILGSTLDLDLLVDTGSAPSTSTSTNITASSFAVTFTDGTTASNSDQINLPQYVPSTSVPVSLNNVTVSGKATVTETDDSSLDLIDSGFIINTDNPFVGYSIVSADFNKDGKSDVAVGNRGYTDTSGTLVNYGSIQILMGGQPLLLDSATGNLSAPTTSDTASTDSGNSGGFSIVGISDTGQANGQFPLSMATGDVEGKGYIDLVIGAPNTNKDSNGNVIGNAVYVIYGSYLASASPETVIDVTSLTSDQGFTINAPSGIGSGDNFGFAVAVGNFDNSGGDDIAIGAPSANSGDGAVYIAYNPATESTPTSTPLYSGQSGEQAGYALATSAYQEITTTTTTTTIIPTFSGNTTIDDLIVGAPSHTIAVNNNWSGLSGLPTNNPNPFADSSSVEVGAVYVFTGNSNSSSLQTSPSYTYLGTDASTPSANGAAQPLLAGSALASGDWDGDSQLDLAIAAPGADQNDGTVFVLSGGTASANNNPQYLNSQDTNGNFTGASNLIINGGLPLSQTGAVVTSAGDVNYDTYEDLLITAPQSANGTGQSYVVFGKSKLLGGTGTIYDLNVTASDNKATFLLNGSEPYQLAGQAAAAIGDINDDGVDDLMISAPNANQLYAVYGHPWLADDGSIKLSNISGDNGFVIDGDLYSVGNETLIGTGNNVVMLGDINGDGFADVLTGGSFNGGVITFGANGAVIIFGASTQDLLDAATGTDELVITVSNNGQIQEVLSLGDFNGDGLQDFGVIDTNNTFYLVLGNNSLGTQGTLAVDSSYSTVSSISQANSMGDINGDGYDDLILTETSNTTLFLGNAQGNFANSQILADSQENSFSVGDLNGDGYNDFVQTQNTSATSTNIGNANSSAFNELEIVWGGNNVNNLTPESYLSATNQPFNGTLNGQMAGGNGDFNGDGQADFFVSAAQPVALMVVETSNSYISYAYFDPFSINWDTDTQVLLNLQTTTHTYSTSDETIGVASYQGNWYFAHSENYVYWLSGSAINQNSENQFGSEYDYAKPQLITAGDNLYMVVAGWNSNNPYISLYDSGTWGPPDTSNPEDSWTNAVTDTNDQDVVTAAVGNLIYFAWTHNSDLYYGYWDTTNSTFTSLGNPTLSSLGVSGDKDPLSMTAINGVLYLALYDSSGDAWLTTYNTAASSPSWQSATEILYTQGNTQVKAEENSITLLGINGQLYVSWYDTAQITPQSKKDKTQYVYLTTTTNPTSTTPTWSNSLLLFNTQAGAGLDITGNGDRPGLTPFAWTGMTSILTNNAQGNGTDSLLTLEGATLPLPSTTDNPTLSNYGSLGNQVRFIGDINGDGYDDVLINSPSTALSNQGTPDGALFVIFGNDQGTNSFNLQNLTGNTQEITLVFSSTLNENSSPPASAFSISTESSNAPTVTGVTLSGNQVTLTLDNIVDTNNSFSVTYTLPQSGNPLQYVSASGSGSGSVNNVKNFTASLDKKKETPSAPKILSTSYQHQGFMITGLPGSQAGISIDGGGDVNGDGFDDFIIGAPGDGDNLAYTLFGSDFNQTVNQTGTIGDDVMLGSPTGESFVAGQGDDFIETKGGADVVYAGPGDDYVTVSDTYFRRLDGGAGQDVLFFEGYNGQDWDLTTLSPGMRLRNFEVLVTEDFGANTLTLNSLTVTELSSTNTVTVYLDEEDQLVLSFDFDYAGTVYQDNQQFSKYTSNQSAATVLSNRVQALPPAFSYSAPGFSSELFVVTSAGEVSYYDGTNLEMLVEKTISPVIAVDMGEIVPDLYNYTPDPEIVVGLANGDIQYYDNDNNHWIPLTETTSPITVIAGNWEGTNQVPEVVVGLSGGEVYYYDGGISSTLIQLGNMHASITAMAANWEGTGNPEVVVGLANGQVQYYDGNEWKPLASIDLNSPPSITAMVANWEGTGNPEVVVGLANGEVQYYDGNNWVPLSSPYVNDTITAIAANWEGTGNPEVVVGVGGESETATLSYYEDGEWYTLYTSTTSEQINSIAVDFSVQVPAGGLTKSGYEPASAIGFGSSKSPGFSLIPYYDDYFNFDASVVDMSASFTGFTGSVSASKANINLINQTPYLTLEAGGLILSSATGDILWWTTDSYGNPLPDATQALMQDDGNFVVSNGTDTLWESKTSGNDGAYLQLNTDGGLYILSASGSVLSTLYSVSESAGSSDSVFQLTAGNQILSGQSVGFWGSQPQEGVWAPLTNSPQPIFPNNDSAATAMATSLAFSTTSDFSTTASLTTSLAALENTIPSLPTQIYVSNPTVAERTGRAEFTLTRTGDLDKYVWVDYLTQDGDAKAGDRYLPVVGQLVFSPNETSKTVTVTIPNNGRFVGDRQFELLVTLVKEGYNPADFPLSFALEADANGEQIRRWSLIKSDTQQGLLGGTLEFDTTLTNGQAQLDVSVNNIGDFNTFYSYNSQTDNYEELMLNGSTGANFTYSPQNQNGTPDGIQLTLKDGDRGDVDNTLNGLAKTNGYAGRTIPGLITNNNQTFWAPTTADGQVQWRLINAPAGKYELGWIAVDDQNGTINGLAPTDAGYEAAALARKQIVFQDQSSSSNSALTRTFAQESFTNPSNLAQTEAQFFGDFETSNLTANQYYLLYSTEGSQTTFSAIDTPEIQTDSRGYHQLSFNGITAEIGSSTLVIPGVLNQSVQIEASLSRAAAYNNLVALYQVDSLTGGLDTNGDKIMDFKPGDQGYTQAALERAIDPLTGVSLTTPENLGTTQQTINLLGHNMYGMVIIPNATIEQVLTQNPSNNPNLGPVALFSFGSANPDGISHMARLGSNLFGFEDLLGGGDRDYNDMILQIEIPSLV